MVGRGIEIMSNVGYYRGTAEVEDAMAVVAKWISANRSIKVVYHKGAVVDADVMKGVIRIPRMACASGVTEDALMLVRGQVYHEAGHIGETKGVDRAEYPKGALFSVWNALEDRRMESVVADKHVGAGPAFSWMMDFYHKEIAGKAGKEKAALWESLVAMSFQSEGKAPIWKLSDKAQVYFDKGYDKFCEWRGCADVRATLELAKELHELLKDASEDFKQKQNQGGGQGEGEEGEGEEGQEKQEGKGKSKKSKKGEKGEEKSEGGEGGEGDDKGEKDEDGEGSGSGSGDFEDEEEGEEGKQEKGKEEDKDGEEDGEGGDSEGADGSDGDGDAEGESDGDGAEGGKADSKAGKSEDGEASEGDGKVVPGGEYNPQDEEAQGGKGEDWGKELEDECDGVTQQEVAGKVLAEMFGDMDTSDLYFSRRDLDVHAAVPSDDDSKTMFKGLRESCGVAVASMTGALKQALRSMSRVRKNPYQRQGRIDGKRLVAISQGLSKEVFFRKTDGVDLDVAVEIVIDESGSMIGKTGEVAKLAAVLGETLKAIGVPFEVTGSTTMYQQGEAGMPAIGDMDRVNPIIYKHYKTFGEDWAAVRQRVVNVSSNLHNVDGEVVEYAAFRLAGRKERRKIVFSLSDGEPCAGHNNDMDMGRNLKRVCERARKNGVEVYGFGIGSYAPQTFYGARNFMFLEKADTMGADFIRDFVGKITGGRVRV